MFGFLERIEHGWDMTVESLDVLRQDKELLVFPILGLLSAVAFNVAIAVPMWLSGYGKWFLAQEDWGRDPLLWLAVFVNYVVSYFVILFFECAVAACAIIRLRGGDPTVSDGLRAAVSRFPQLAAWAVVGGTVGLLLKIAEKRSERFEHILAGIAGFAWSWATFFIVPVLVIEKVGPIDALRRSGQLIRNYWGESFVADLGIGLIGFLGMFPAFLMIIAGAVSLSQHREFQGYSLFVSGWVLLLTTILITTTLETIARAALYAQAASEKKLRRFEKRVLGD